MASMLEKWPQGQASRLNKDIVQFNHRLAETGLFEDEALARLLDTHPRENMTICTMRENPPPGERWVAGDADNLDGGQLLEAVKRGSLWVSPRGVMTCNAEYRDVFRKLMDEFSEQSRQRIITADGSMLISGPNMGIFMHVDVVDTMLWHIRGQKTLHVYPAREDIVTEDALEAILLKETLSDLPYRADMEADVVSLSLEPGQAVAWPLHSPHRVVNADCLNVSVSIEYTTVNSILANGSFYVNGRLRRALGWAPRSRSLPAAVRPAYALVAKTLKTIAPLKGTVEQAHERLFDVDLSAPGCIAWRGGQSPLTLAAE